MDPKYRVIKGLHCRHICVFLEDIYASLLNTVFNLINTHDLINAHLCTCKTLSVYAFCEGTAAH